MRFVCMLLAALAACSADAASIQGAQPQEEEAEGMPLQSQEEMETQQSTPPPAQEEEQQDDRDPGSVQLHVQPRSDGMPRHVSDSKQMFSEKGSNDNNGPAMKIKEGVDKALGLNIKHTAPLSKDELAGIYDVACLKQKQLNRNYPCGGDQTYVPEVWSGGPLNIGNYPKWSDHVCHSDGEFFCDPQKILDDDEGKKKVIGTINYFRDKAKVDCGAMDYKLHHRPMGNDIRNFNLGVVLANEWEESESDSASLQKFGMMLMTRWGFMPWYNGVDTGNTIDEYNSVDDYTKNCPNAALLIILPDRGQAFLASPSCEFICKDRGGPEIVARVKRVLEKEGLENAIKAGVDAVNRALKMTTPKTLHRGTVRGKKHSTMQDEIARSEDFWSFIVLCLFFAVCGGLMLTVVGVVTYVVRPQLMEWFGVLPPNEMQLRKS
eukprot:gnl/TRDRNA2_/TRDRNA2_67001_c0_seq1.p1 gnl/TRDRNA2_/TRDRNA2_67001_c0~~gnl/TRDRNA2_/TRDRNA2_67001_c0_seq1.p1  ORF type:complete len:434 (-),score=85.90 gnl/TRDRNA2_/TRDRNA2_67001_c0_seq1:118-1419(-)